MSLLLNALFHHSLLFIPQQEIPGIVPSAFVMRHPDTGDMEVSYTALEYLLSISISIQQSLKSIQHAMYR